MYPLLELSSDDDAGVAAVIEQGTQNAIHFHSDAECKAFVDRLLIAPHHADHLRFDFTCGAKTYQAKLHIERKQIGLVSNQPTLLQRLPIYDNLELVADQIPSSCKANFDQRLEEAMQETGLLSEVDFGAAAESLPWALQVEVSFVQAWLREPQWLIFDNVFEHGEGDKVARLPALFTSRHPLRAVTYLQTTTELAGRFPIQQELHL